MPPYVLMHPVCLDAPICLDSPCMFGCPHIFGHPLYVCMSPCLDTTHLWMPPYVWMPYCMFGCPPVCLIAPICIALLATLFSLFQCLDASCMFWCPHMFGYHPYVWIPSFMFGHPLYVWMPPYVLMHPLYDWMPTYVWMPLVCLMPPCCPLYVWMPPYV